MSAKRFKVWNVRRTVKKGVVASSLSELIRKGREKLDLFGDDVIVVLECDGTEVDDEDYFSFLPADTVLLLLESHEKWRPHVEQAMLDETDCTDEIRTDGKSLADLTQIIKRDVSQLITLSCEELQSLVDVDVKTLSGLLDDARLARSVHNACQRYLDERQEATEAIQLLKLYHKAEQHYHGDGSNEAMSQKRPRKE